VGKYSKKFIKSVKAPLSIQEVYTNDTKTGKKREEKKNTRKTQKQEETQTPQQSQPTNPREYPRRKPRTLIEITENNSNKFTLQ